DFVEASPVQKLDSLKTLVEDMNFGRVKTLFILGGNPVYNGPADLDFETALKRVPLRVHHASHIDETSFLCHWHLPATHELEMWSDGRAYEGTACLIQPLIAPLYQGRSAHEVLAVLNGQYSRSGYEVVREYWRGASGVAAANFEAWWEKCLHDGVIPKTAAPPRGDITINVQAIAATAPTSQPGSSTATANTMEIAFRPDPHIRDGRHANNGWLQEVPKPLTRLSWDNAALMSPATARRYGVIDNSDAPANNIQTSIVELSLYGRKVEAPAWVMQGQ